VDIFLEDEVDWIKDIEALANVQLPILLNLSLPLLLEPLKEDKTNLFITLLSSTPK